MSFFFQVYLCFVFHCVCVFINLLTETYRCDEKRNLNTKLLPKKPARTLRNTLEQLYQKVNKSLENYVNLSIQDSSHDEGIDRDFQLKRKEVGCIPVVCVNFSKP